MPQPLDPNGFQPLPSSAPNSIAGMVQRNPGVFMPGSLGGGFRYLQSQDVAKEHQQESEQHQDISQQRTFGEQREQQRRSQDFESRKRKDYGPQIPIPGDPTHALQQVEDPFGRKSIQKVLAVPKAGAKTATAEEQRQSIVIGLDQLEQGRHLLGRHPGLPVLTQAGQFMWQKHTGYPEAGQMDTAINALSDAVPKALAGRSSQAAIDNARGGMIPSPIRDTQQSFDARMRVLRALFPRKGPMPSNEETTRILENVAKGIYPSGSTSQEPPPTAKEVPNNTRMSFDDGTVWENRGGVISQIK